VNLFQQNQGWGAGAAGAAGVAPLPFFGSRLSALSSQLLLFGSGSVPKPSSRLFRSRLPVLSSQISGKKVEKEPTNIYVGETGAGSAPYFSASGSRLPVFVKVVKELLGAGSWSQKRARLFFGSSSAPTFGS